jgi:hypothetical protein
VTRDEVVRLEEAFYARYERAAEDTDRAKRFDSTLSFAELKESIAQTYEALGRTEAWREARSVLKSFVDSQEG